MPRRTHGDQVKERVKRLLEALLCVVDGEFEDGISGIKHNDWKEESSTNPKLIVETTLRHLEYLTDKDKYPGKLTNPQIREALHLLDKKRNDSLLKILEDHRTTKRGSANWHFTLKLWSKDKKINLEKFEQEWESKRPEKSKKPEDFKPVSNPDPSSHINNSTELEKKEKARKFLRSFDCAIQESYLKPKIVKDKCGFFPTQVDKSVELWFRWRLTKCMGDFDKIKKIQIDIDYSIVKNFKFFWQKIGEYVDKKGDFDSDAAINELINELIQLCEKQPVMIVIKNAKQLSRNRQKEMFEFCEILLKSFKGNIDKHRSYLVIFLIERKNTDQDTSQEYSTQIDIDNDFLQQEMIEIEFIKFLQQDIENWLDENQSNLKEENFDADIKPEMINYLLKQESDILLDEICKNVFKLNNGIADVEDYWRKFA